MKSVLRNALMIIFIILLFQPVTRGHRSLLASAGGSDASGRVSVPVDLSTGIPLVEIGIGDEGPFLFALDVNAGETSIGSRLAERLGLTRSGTGATAGSTDAGVSGAHRVRIGTFRVGTVTFKDVAVEVSDNSPSDDADGSPDGVLGFPLFAGYLATIDYANGSLILEKGRLAVSDGRDIVAYATDEKGRPVLPLEIAGLEVNAILDPGLPGSIVLNSRYIDRLSLPAPPRMIGRAVTDEGEFLLRSTPYSGTLRLGGQQIDRDSIRFLDLVEEGGIGLDLLTEYAITFDQTTKHVRLRKDHGRARRIQEIAASTPSLADGGNDLRTAFNRDRGRVRLLLILSPT